MSTFIILFHFFTFIIINSFYLLKNEYIKTQKLISNTKTPIIIKIFDIVLSFLVSVTVIFLDASGVEHTIHSSAPTSFSIPQFGHTTIFLPLTLV